MVEIKKACDFCELRKEVWSGAVDTLNKIAENNKTQQLMELIENTFYEVTEITSINDFLWFDSEYIFNQLEIEGEE